MSVTTLQALELHLPDTAPRLRITTGLGTATEKSWNVKRPVTLIGARRPAHIVLHDRKVSPAHCVIINDGRHVFVKDLCSRSATFCNGVRVDLAALFDGDVLTINGINIQITIKHDDGEADASGTEQQCIPDMVYDEPVELRLVHTHQRWLIREGVTLIGGHEAAPINLAHEDVSRRHAIIFKFGNRPAVFDLGGQGGLRINGRLCTLGPLNDGDRLSIGPFRLQVTQARSVSSAQPRSIFGQEPASTDTLSFSPSAGNDPVPGTASTKNRAELVGAGEMTLSERLIEAKLDEVAEGIVESWGQLDALQTQLLSEATQMGVQEKDLTTREAELDSLDAALRGQLHDIERLEEELQARERELEQQSRKLDRDNAELTARAAVIDEKEADVTKRCEELSRREHVFAQRWSRLKGTSCPHCGNII